MFQSTAAPLFLLLRLRLCGDSGLLWHISFICLFIFFKLADAHTGKSPLVGVRNRSNLRQIGEFF
jgi:hypothetical protein